jgi:hypothetical protein
MGRAERHLIMRPWTRRLLFDRRGPALLIVLALLASGCARKLAPPPSSGARPLAAAQPAGPQGALAAPGPPVAEVAPEPAPGPAPDDRASRAAEAKERGTASLEAGDPQGAIPDLVLAAELAPGDVEARFALGLAYFQLDDHARARPELEAALERDPRCAPALEYLGRIEYAAGRMDRALADYRAALAAAPERAGLKELIAQAERDGKVEASFTERYTDHFHMKCEGGAAEQAVADRVADALERAYLDVGFALGQYPGRRIPVILYADRAFYEVTGSHGWVGGLFDGKIRIPVKDLFRHDDGALARVATHEYAHACIYTLAPRCPTWLQEGLAQHFEGARPDPAALSGAASLPPFASLGETFVTTRDPDAARLRYAASLGFVEFLIARRGVGEVAGALRELGAGKSLDQALERSFGSPLAALDAEWRASLR